MSDALQELIAVVAKLRDPDGGCPWDLEQTHQSLVPYVLEEAHEVADAIRYGDDAHLKDCLLYTSPSPRDGLLSRMPSSA